MLTFHKTLAGCEEGSRRAWQGFVATYTPAMLRFLRVYAPACDEECQKQVWQKSLQLLCTGNFQRLRTFDHQSEREFVCDLRAFLLETVADQLDLAADNTDNQPPTPHTVKALLKGLPLIHQVVVFLRLAGYSNGTLKGILTITPALAEQSRATATEVRRYPAAGARWRPVAGRLDQFAAARLGRWDGCLPPSAPVCPRSGRADRLE